MPLSFFIPLGVLIAIIGLLVYFVTKRKRMALGIIIIGLTVTIGTIVVIVLAVNTM